MANMSTGSPFSELDPEEKARRASSFGSVASHYERFRPGPPDAAVDWFVPTRVNRVADLGAGTGALTRLLLDRAAEVVAVEPSDGMRAVLSEQVPRARVVEGRGESIPLPDASTDAVLASSSWHWMDPLATLREVARILVPGGTLGAVWSGPDPDGPFMRQAQAVLADYANTAAGSGGSASELLNSITANVARSQSQPSLEIPPGAQFSPPEHKTFTWRMALNADELIGLLGTMSWIILMPDRDRQQVLGLARQLLADVFGVQGEVTVDVEFRADAWRSRRDG